MPTVNRLKIAFFGSSLISSYWNGTATYYRGIIKALAERGHQITFYEPDAFERQKHRDIEDPEWAKVVVYRPTLEGARQALQSTQDANILVKASGVGVLDEWLERELLRDHGSRARNRTVKIFWDMDPPATLQRINENINDPLRLLIPRYDLILTYGGGQKVSDAYTALGAHQCHPIYNALDPDVHYPVAAEARFNSLLGFLGNRLPDREMRTYEFFFKAVSALPDAKFILGGSGWESMASQYNNLCYPGHIYTRNHNAFNCSSLAVLNIDRNSVERTGFCSPARVFEAAGAGACLIVDRRDGVQQFLRPGHEVLLAANGDEVVTHLKNLTREKARAIGDAARQRLLSAHTYRHRALQFEELIASRYPQRASA